MVEEEGWRDFFNRSYEEIKTGMCENSKRNVRLLTHGHGYFAFRYSSTNISRINRVVIAKRKILTFFHIQQWGRREISVGIFNKRANVIFFIRYSKKS